MGIPSALVTALGTLLAGVVASGAILWAAAQRRRAAIEIGEKAREEAERLLRHAARDADNLRKEAAIEAREKAHEIAAGAEQ